MANRKQQNRNIIFGLKDALTLTENIYSVKMNFF